MKTIGLKTISQHVCYLLNEVAFILNKVNFKVMYLSSDIMGIVRFPLA